MQEQEEVKEATISHICPTWTTKTKNIPLLQAAFHKQLPTQIDHLHGTTDAKMKKFRTKDPKQNAITVLMLIISKVYQTIIQSE